MENHKFRVVPISLVFTLCLILVLSLSLTSATQLYPVTETQSWSITQTGNEANFNVNLSNQEVDVSNLWTRVLAFLKLSEKDYEDWTAIEICSGELLDKDTKLKETPDGWEVQDKKSKDNILYFIPNKLSRKDIEGKEVKRLTKDIKEEIKDTIKPSEKFCYYDLINPKTTDYIKYGENSIVITKTYNYTAQAILNQTTANANFAHLSVNNTANKYAVFDGAGDYVTVPYGANINLTSLPHTLSVWVKPEVLAGGIGDIFLSSGRTTNDRLYLAILNGGWEFGLETTPWGMGTTPANFNWNHLVLVLNGTHGVLYVNGDYDHEKNYTGNWVLAQNFDFGRHPTSPGTYDFNGSIDDVLIFNRALNSTEIAEIYALNRSRYNLSTEGLVGQWDFNDGVDNYKDKSGNENDGTGVGNVYTAVDTNFPYNSPYDSLVGYWSFDGDNNVTAYDLSGNENHGGYVGNAFSGDGKFGEGIEIASGDSSAGGVALSSTLSLPTDRSISLWIKTEDPSIGVSAIPFSIARSLVGSYPALAMRIREDEIRFYTRWSGTDAFVAGSSGISGSGWRHIVGVKNATHQLIYIDGQYTNIAVANDEGIANSTLSSAIGYYRNVEGQYRQFQGSIDEVMIFNKALTEQEISDIYNNQSKRFKSEGTVTPPQITLNESGYSRVRLNASVERLLNTGVGARLGYCDNSSLNCSDNANYTFTDYQSLDSSGSATFNIPTTTTNLLPEFRMFANNTEGNESFYTPLLYNTLDFRLWLYPSITLLTDKSSPIDYLETLNVSCSSTSNSINLFQNTTNITDQNNLSRVLGAGSYLFNCTSLETEDYAYAEDSIEFQINKISPTDLMEITGTSPIIYETESDFEGIETNTGDGDVVYTLTPDNAVFGAGDIEFDYSATEGENYTAGSIQRTLTINKKTPVLDLTSSAGWTLPSASYSTIEGVCPSQITCLLFEVGEAVTNPYTKLFSAGSYLFLTNTTGNANYTESSLSKILNSQVSTNGTIQTLEKFGYGKTVG
jgi:hypothetical protein